MKAEERARKLIEAIFGAGHSSSEISGHSRLKWARQERVYLPDLRYTLWENEKLIGEITMIAGEGREAEIEAGLTRWGYLLKR